MIAIEHLFNAIVVVSTKPIDHLFNAIIVASTKTWDTHERSSASKLVTVLRKFFFYIYLSITAINTEFDLVTCTRVGLTTDRQNLQSVRRRWWTVIWSIYLTAIANGCAMLRCICSWVILLIRVSIWNAKIDCKAVTRLSLLTTARSTRATWLWIELQFTVWIVTCQKTISIPEAKKSTGTWYSEGQISWQITYSR